MNTLWEVRGARNTINGTTFPKLYQLFISEESILIIDENLVSNNDTKL